jgi:hypothetical protein
MVSRLIFTTSDYTHLLTLIARLDMQAYYPCASVDTLSPNIRLNSIRLFNTSRSVISIVSEMQTRSRFATHAPNWFFRVVLTACSVLTASLHSPLRPDLTIENDDAATALLSRVHAAMVAFSIREGDLPNRAAIMMETFWAARHLMPMCDFPLYVWKSRTGAGIALGTLEKLKGLLLGARKKNADVARGLAAINTSKSRNNGMDFVNTHTRPVRQKPTRNFES